MVVYRDLAEVLDYFYYYYPITTTTVEVQFAKPQVWSILVP